MKKALQLVSSIAVYGCMVSWGIQIAYEQRGYQAIGSEYLLALLMAAAAYWAVGKWFESR